MRNPTSVIVSALAFFSFAVLQPLLCLGNVIPDNGPSAGGNAIIVTNSGTLGNGSDITNVSVCGIQATISDQDTNWLSATLGAGPEGGAFGDVLIQSASLGDTALTNAYTYNPAGEIGRDVLPSTIILTDNWLNGNNGAAFEGSVKWNGAGTSVSDAGDINGDGFGDFLIGAWGADPGGQTNAGEGYLVYGTSNSYPSDVMLTNTWLDGTNGSILQGAVTLYQCGHSVSGAGDIDGDGLDDFLISAYLANPGGQSQAGETYLVYGTTNGYPSEVILTNTWLNSTNGCILQGAVAGDKSGISVSGAGDINSDGFHDFLIGAYGANEAYLIYGTTNGYPSEVILTNTWLDGTNGFMLQTTGASDQCGKSVSSAGDVNGDGFDDFLIGAQLASPGGVQWAGETYLIYGTTNAYPPQVTLDNTWLDGTNGSVLQGTEGQGWSGCSVSGAGDINGDGFDDFIVGANGANPGGRFWAGEAYLVYGTTNRYPSEVILNNTWLDGTNGIILQGADEGEWCGSDVSDAGDINGDGLDDFLIGARRANKSYLVYGTTNGYPSEVILANTWLDSTNGIALHGAYNCGGSVSGAGDINGDGLADILIGASLSSPDGRGNAGEAYLVLGSVWKSGVAPGSGPIFGGATTTILGSYLGNGTDITNVYLCEIPANTIISQSATQVVVASGASGGTQTGDVKVCSISFGTTTKHDAYSYELGYIILAEPNESGTLDPAGQVFVSPGGDTTIVAQADTYFRVSQLLTNGAADASATGLTTYTSTWDNVTANGTVTVSFAADLAARGTRRTGGWLLTA